MKVFILVNFNNPELVKILGYKVDLIYEDYNSNKVLAS